MPVAQSLSERRLDVLDEIRGAGRVCNAGGFHDRTWDLSDKE